MLDMDVIYREYVDSVFRFLMTLCREVRQKNCPGSFLSGGKVSRQV